MTNFIKKNWDKIAPIAYIALLPVISFAACDPSKGKICNPLGDTTTSIPDLIKNILTDAVKIGIPIVALAIIYCGFLFVFARGSSEKLTKAKDALLYTLIGAAVVLGALAIAQMIQSTITSLGTGS